jgi:8-oxo-dGTP pyrophosphatase MutT (NUDIX family)
MTDRLNDRPIEPQAAAVLVPVYPDGDGDLRVVMIRRSEVGVHGGEIALPGGKQSQNDDSLVATALREAWEEIGLEAEAIEILEHLPSVDTIVTGYRIFPFLARIYPPVTWRLDEREIAEILDIRIKDFTRPGVNGEEMRQFPFWPGPLNIHFYRIGSYKLWGATYRIMHPLIPRLLAGEWSM